MKSISSKGDFSDPIHYRSFPCKGDAIAAPFYRWKNWLTKFKKPAQSYPESDKLYCDLSDSWHTVPWPNFPGPQSAEKRKKKKKPPIKSGLHDYDLLTAHSSSQIKAAWAIFQMKLI